MRTLVDIPDSQIQDLAAMCKRVNQPRAAIVREAIAEYLAKHQRTEEARFFGLWGADPEDGLAFQEKARAEW